MVVWSRKRPRGNDPAVFTMRKQFSTYVPFAAIFAASFLVLDWTYGYVIVYQSQTNDCFFLFGRSFLVEFLDHPAGPLRYAARFLGQFYHYRWLGALIVSASITGFGLLFHRVLARFDKAAPVWQTALPCLLLLALHTSTIYGLQDTLGLCLSCGALLGYLALPGNVAKRAYALAAIPILYFLAGFYVWILVAWIVAFEILHNRPRRGMVFGAACALFSVAVPLVAWRWLFPIPLRSALLCPVLFGPPFRTGWPDQTLAQFAGDCALAVTLGGALLVMPFWSRLFSGAPWRSFPAKTDRRSRLLRAGAIGVLVVLLSWVRYDGPLATVVACRRLYQERQWDALLEEAKDNPYGDVRVQFMTNFALYHKGTLLDQMFRYPQPWGARGLMLNFSGMRVASPEQDDTANGMYNSDLLYELGHAAFALQHAYNCITLHGKTYQSLERMAECSMLNGNEAMAKKYLNLLEKTLFHRDVARRYKAVLADPEAAEREFGELRKRLPAVDGFGHPTRHFLTLLESKTDNRMALDYLMAWLLLEKTPDSLESVCADLGHLRTAGHAALPRHCQEAMLLKEELTQTPADPKGFQPDAAVVARAKEFRRDMSGQGVWLDAETARSLYGDTYMFYWFFTTIPSEAPPSAEPGGGFYATAREE